MNLLYVYRTGNISHDIISKLTEVGGKELVMEKDAYGNNALHKACQSENTRLNIISKLIEVEGRTMRRDG